MDLPNSLNEIMSSAATALAGAGASWLALRRKYSSDTTGIAKDKAESSLMATLIAERDMAMTTAREAWAQRTEDARQIARLEARLDAEKLETARLRDELFSMRLHVRKLTSVLVKLDPTSASILDITEANGDGISTAFMQEGKGDETATR